MPGHLSPGAFLLGPHMAQGKLNNLPQVSARKELNPFMRAQSLWLDHLPIPALFNMRREEGVLILRSQHIWNMWVRAHGIKWSQNTRKDNVFIKKEN